MIVMVVFPTDNPDVYEGRVDGLVICRSRQPYYDGARVLLQGGTDPKTRYLMQHDGSSTDCLIGTVGEAARWTIKETINRLVLAPWQEHPKTVSGTA